MSEAASTGIDGFGGGRTGVPFGDRSTDFSFTFPRSDEPREVEDETSFDIRSWVFSLRFLEISS